MSLPNPTKEASRTWRVYVSHTLARRIHTYRVRLEGLALAHYGDVAEIPWGLTLDLYVAQTSHTPPPDGERAGRLYHLMGQLLAQEREAS